MKEAKERKGWVKILLGFILFAALGLCIYLACITFIGSRPAKPTLPGSVLSGTDFKAEYDSAAKTSMEPCPSQGGFFVATQNGISFYSSGGETKMTDSFNVSDPVLIEEGGAAAVWEKGGRQLYVYNTEGRLYAGESDSPIVSAAINSSGYFSAITRNGEGYRILLFNPSGQKTYGDPQDDYNVIPVSTDVSDDGRILAISYMDINGITIDSKVSFAYANKSESVAHTSDFFASSETFEDQIVIVKFMEGNKLLCLSDKEVFCLAPEPSAKKLWGMDLGNKLTAVGFDGKNGFALAFGEKLLNMDGQEKNTAIFYDLDMTPLFSFSARDEITLLQMTKDGGIVGCASEFTGVGKGGALLWAYSAPRDVKKACYINGIREVALYAPTRIEIMKVEK